MNVPADPIVRYAPGLPLTSIEDVKRELQRIGLATEGLVRMRGVFTPATAAQMSPSPAPNDLWIEVDPATNTYQAYLQLTVAPVRKRASWPVSVEGS